MNKKYYIYILECSNGNYYTGYTTDIERRYKEHQEGTSKCKYTRSFPPERIAACWRTQDISLALKIEKAVKKLSKQEKMNLIFEKIGLQPILKKLGFDASAVEAVLESSISD